MLCPICESGAKTKTVDTRSYYQGRVTSRRRECPDCGARFTTVERWDLDWEALKSEIKASQEVVRNLEARNRKLESSLEALSKKSEDRRRLAGGLARKAPQRWP